MKTNLEQEVVGDRGKRAAGIRRHGKLEAMAIPASAKAFIPRRLSCTFLLLLFAVLLGRATPSAAQTAPSFSQAVNYSTGGNQPSSVFVADVNGDGIQDVVVASQGGGTIPGNGSVTVFLGNGDGTLQPPQTYDSGGPGANSVFVIDVNHDGSPDIVVANHGNGITDGSVGVLLNNADGSGTFKAAVTYDSGGPGAQSVFVADVNNDTNPDIVVANQGGGTTSGDGSVGLLLNDGGGTFNTSGTAPTTIYDSGGVNAVAVALSDLKGNGYPYILVANNCFGVNNCPQQQGGIAVFANNGNSSGVFQGFSLSNNYEELGGYLTSMAIGDVNGDGKPDVFVDSGYLLGNGDGTFQPFTGIFSDFPPGQVVSVAVGDVNADTFPDLLSGLFLCGSCDSGLSSGVTIRPGQDGGLFPVPYNSATSPVTFTTGGQDAVSIALGNLNCNNSTTATLCSGDYYPDLAVANACNHLITVNSCNGNLAVLLNLLNTTANPLTTALTVSATPPILPGQSVTYMATLSKDPGNSESGSVAFWDINKNYPYGGGEQVCSSGINRQTSGVYLAKCSSGALSAGTHQIAAIYSQPSTTTTPLLGAFSQISPVLTENVFYTTTTTLTSSSPTSLQNQPVTFTATIHTTQPAQDLSGEVVTFSDSANSFSPVTESISGTVAKLTTSNLSPGSHTITATYSADSYNNGPSSNTVSQTVETAPILNFNPSPLAFGPQTIGAASSSLPVTVTNPGSLPLTIASVVVSGDTTDFSETDNCVSTSPLAGPGGMCTIQVTFSAQVVGSRSATITLTDSYGNVEGSLQVSGSGVAAPLAPPVPVHLSFNPGTNVKQGVTLNCPSNTVPCTDPQAHSFTLTISTVTQPLTMDVTVTEVSLTEANGVCETGNPNDTTDFDCRLASTFAIGSSTPGNPITVPQCIPYSNGNCVYYHVSNVSSLTSFRGPVLETIAWNNNAYVPSSTYEADNPRLYDDPDLGAYAGNLQFLFDITDYFDPAPGQVDPGVGGKTKTLNAFVVAYPAAVPQPPYTVTLQPPFGTGTPPSNPEGTPLPVSFSLTQGGTPIANATTSPNAASIGVLNSSGARMPALALDGTAAAFTYNATAQLYSLTLSTYSYPPDTYTLYVNSNLFVQQLATFVITSSPLRVVTTALPAGQFGQYYIAPITATGGTQPYTSWALTSGPLPTGITLNTADGVLSGTPMQGGTFPITVQVTDTANTTASASLNITISAATGKTNPVITWLTPAAITYGTPLSNSQLDATANVAGSFTYTPGPGTILKAGPQLLSVTFTPTNTTAYNTVSASVTLLVNQAKPPVLWLPIPIIYGTLLGPLQLDALTFVPGTFTYTPPKGTLLTAGQHTLSALFTPNDTTDFETITVQATLEVFKATPHITWPQPASIKVGTPLGAAQLDATANVPGTFIYNPPAGTILRVGTWDLKTTFTPSDGANYRTVEAQVDITVKSH